MRLLPAIVAFFVYACTSSTAGSKKENSFYETTSSKKVLLELFTSQGCSSCPPADELVSKLAEKDTNLIVLSFHVDYWDRLGWKDIFSNHDYTLRQQQYVRALHAQSAYTPQAVIQGQFEMVGSNQPGILNAVKTARSQSNDAEVIISSSVANHLVTIHYQLAESLFSGNLIMAVLVQNHANTTVKRGENSGRQLMGYHIVRSMKSMTPTKTEDSIQLSLPDDLSRDNASVVVLIQDISSRKIIAAKQVLL